MRGFIALVCAALVGLVALEVSLFRRYLSERPSSGSQPATPPATPPANAKVEPPPKLQPSPPTYLPDEEPPTLTKSAGDLLKGAVNKTRQLDGIGLRLTRLSAKEEMGVLR